MSAPNDCKHWNGGTGLNGPLKSGGELFSETDGIIEDERRCVARPVKWVSS